MTADNQFDALESKIRHIESDIEKQNAKANKNRISAKHFMFFLLVGADDDKRALLERKVRDLLRNPDACSFMSLSASCEASDCGNEIEQTIRQAAANHIDVDNLNTLFFCPIVFTSGYDCNDITPILLSIDDYVMQMGRVAIWQPFIVFNKEVAQYAKIYKTFENISNFISKGRSGSITRCCLISDQDADGFMVQKDNIMQTIAMTVVLLNAQKGESIKERLTISSNELKSTNIFFTARNAAIVNPIRSTVFERIRSAMDYFSDKPEINIEHVLARMNFSFITGIIKPYIEKLPQVNGKITFFPLYSIMASSESRQQLSQIINKLYAEPLLSQSALSDQLGKARRAFLNNYFASNGSLQQLYDATSSGKLKKLLAVHESKCTMPPDIVEGPLDRTHKKLEGFVTGQYAEARQYCEGSVMTLSINLLRKLAEGFCSAEEVSRYKEVLDNLEKTKKSIGEKIRKLQDEETVLVLGQTVHSSEFDEVQREWFRSRVNQHSSDYMEYNRHFYEMVYKIIIGENVDYSEILDVCYAAVKDSGESNLDYLRNLSDECSNAIREKEFASDVKKSWSYPLRLLRTNESGDVTCIIGDSKFRFCETLCKAFGGSMYEFKDFDRIDVLHISDSFTADNILEWEQIKKAGEQVVG